MVEWVGIAIALAAAYFAWRANHKSDDANEIARRALALTEAEHEQQRRDREARARLVVAASIVTYEPGEDGVIRLGGSSGNLRMTVTITNEGDRDAGRGHVHVTLPLSMRNTAIRWADAGGHPLPDQPQHAGQLGDHYVIAREIDGVARVVPEMMWLIVPVDVPYQDNINEYPIRIRVAAEGADAEAALDFPLRIGRDPSI